MDIKVLIKEEKGLQLWGPRMKEEFPVTLEILRDEVFPAFDVAAPEFNRSEYSLEQFLDHVIKPHPELYVARVFKRRFGYTVADCITEIAELLINGAAVKTVAVESDDPYAVLKAKEMIGLQEYENVNYLLAIKRILGMEPLPE